MGGVVGETSDDSYRVEANPEKRFFISMLVKDIELLPAILDLVDNSVDGARSIRPDLKSEGRELTPEEEEQNDRRYVGLLVELTANGQEFEIRDNCGGIDIDTARKYAFRFGRAADFKGVESSVGQFGVGMKRALFKLGSYFTVESVTTQTRFVLHVDVEEWAADNSADWSFRLAVADEDFEPGNVDEVGTSIAVTSLHEFVAEDFSDSQILASLKYQLRLRHREAMGLGMTIKLNGETITPFVPTLLTAGAELKPIHRNFIIGEPESSVTVRMYAGIDKVERSSDAEAEDVRTERDAGWYLFCNGRLLFAAERTSLTGWGSGMPVYHNQFNRFRGYVYLEAANPSLLPWNTTKTGVDADSKIWRQVRGSMITAGMEVIALLNRLKTERETSASPEERPISTVISMARSVELRQVGYNTTLVYPKTRPPRAPSSVQKMQYSVDKTQYQRVARALRTNVVAEVGRRTFDYFYAAQIDEDD